MRKFKEPLRSRPTYEITDAGMASVKYEAGIKKKTAVLLRDSKGNKSTEMPYSKKSERSQADAHCRHSSGVSEEVILKEEAQAGLTNVLTCDDTTLASSGLPAKPKRRESGKKELIVQVQAETKGDRLNKKIVITNEGYTVYGRETVSASVTGE
ncbi:hypothetical protein DPMN_118845 [Dreissena polymorpha]|uniref:Uncharacterized protein n=1 Tax=Dreissena polymorpha TaxID=45954 RepID=A0A9D4JRG1_DREPO|nr:hypothetical protein DPMN_118845 [Dreissena polymorpha]